ncbi:MAG: LysR family transcriptional regulator [Cellvibrionaceae bacterium]|nr:LysR family transcriptional regulator [Cellvibrionaceae bacterium]
MRPDLNLLTALRVLSEERNVTHAARRLNVSQPAMSKTLQKLREELNDPLFTRSSHGLIPTPRAKQLETELPGLLDKIGDLVHPSEFAPVDYRGWFNIAGTAYILNLLLPSLSVKLLQQAPNTSVRANEVELEFMEQLASGQLDFALHFDRPMPEDYVKTSVGWGEMVCAMRSDHPLAAKGEISLEDYLAYPHVRLYMAQITRSNIGVVDEILSQRGLSRHLILETPEFSTANEVIRQTDCLMVCPDSHKYQLSSGICYLPLPAELGYPPLELMIIQHRRSANSQPHIWLRNIISEIMSAAILKDKLHRQKLQ